MTTTMSACCFRSSMNVWGNRGIGECNIQNAKFKMQNSNTMLRAAMDSVLEFHNRRAAAAFVLRREFVGRDEWMIFQKRSNGAAQLPGPVAVNDPDRMLIRDR